MGSIEKRKGEIVEFEWFGCLDNPEKSGVEGLNLQQYLYCVFTVLIGILVWKTGNRKVIQNKAEKSCIVFKFVSVFNNNREDDVGPVLYGGSGSEEELSNELKGK